MALALAWQVWRALPQSMAPPPPDCAATLLLMR